MFLLTDGQVSSRQEVINLIKNTCTNSNQQKGSNIKVYAFGVGDGADKILVEDAAKAGKGKSYMVNDANKAQLKSMVIDALQHASEPYLQACTVEFTFGDSGSGALAGNSQSLETYLRKQTLGNVHVNNIVRAFMVLKEEEFMSD